MSQAAPTLGSLFELPSEDDSSRLPGGWQPLREKLTQEVKGIKWAASMPDLTVKMAELLDVQIPGIFVETWRKAEEVKKKLAESRLTPDDTFYAELANHTISTAYHPYISVQIGKAPIKKLEFTVTASFTMKAFVLKIQNGSIREIRTGSCEAEGELKGLGLLLANKQLAPLQLPGRIHVPELQTVIA
jgi:hypothetical protein